MLNFKLKPTETNAALVLAFAVIAVIISFTFYPFILLVGVNLILQTIGLVEIPYTLMSWVGAFLVTFVLRSSK